MEITKEYLDNMIIKNTSESGEIFSLYIDFINQNIDIVNIIDSGDASAEKLQTYINATDYYFTLISNASEFFSSLEIDTGKEILIFKDIKFHFVDNEVEITVETESEKTKEVLENFFEQYKDKLGNDEFTEIITIEVVGE